MKSLAQKRAAKALKRRKKINARKKRTGNSYVPSKRRELIRKMFSFFG